MSFPVIQWQIVTKDPERIARFYQDLFGWTVSTQNGLGYRVVDTGAERGIDGGIWPSPAQTPEMVQLFVEVADIDAMLARLAALGGQILVPRQELPDGDAMALALDPLGRPFGLMTPRDGPGSAAQS